MHWREFFGLAKGWCFQAAQVSPGKGEGLGYMETQYQAFKDRFLEERGLHSFPGVEVDVNVDVPADTCKTPVFAAAMEYAKATNGMVLFSAMEKAIAAYEAKKFFLTPEQRSDR